MRITNNILRRNALSSVQANLRQVTAAQQQVATGVRITKASDDPTGAAETMRADRSLRGLDQYRRNVQSAQARSAAEESALTTLTDVLARAKELGVSQATATATPATRAIVAAEVEHLFRFAVGLANTKHGEEFLFAGDRPDTTPYAVTGTGTALGFTSISPTGTRAAQVTDALQVPTNANGTTVFESSGVLAALRDLSRGLAGNDEDGIRTSLAGLDDAFGSVQELLGDTGARVNQLEVIGANMDAIEINLRTLRSDLTEVDLEKAMTDLVARQNAFQAAMLATSKVMGMNLTDYLR